MRASLDDIQRSLGEHGLAWRTVYNAYLKDAEACHNVAVMCGCFGTTQYALRLRDGHEPELTDTRVLDRLHRHAEALKLPAESVTQTMANVMDRPLFTGVPDKAVA